MANYDENAGGYRSTDNSLHYSEHDADKHSSTINSGGYGDSGGNPATKGAELLASMADMSEGMMLSVAAALMTAGIMFASFFWGNSYGYAVYINWWFLIVPLLAGVVMKFLEALLRPVAGLFMVLISLSLGVLLWLNLRTQGEFKMQSATITEGAKMRTEPSENAATLRSDNSVNVLGVTKNGWVLTVNYPSTGWVKAENISVNGGKELKTIQTAVVLANTLNIHSYPRLSSKIQTNYELKYAKKGDRVYITGAEEEGWLPVYYFVRNQYDQASSIAGYVPASNVFVDDGSGARKPAGLTAPKGIKEITAMYGSIYLFSRMINDVRFYNKEIPEGDKFVMLDNPTSEKGWIRAWYDGVEGWVKVANIDKTQLNN